MKKYLIRAIGALCILGAVAMLFLSAGIEIDGVSKKELRQVRTDTEQMLTKVETYVSSAVSSSGADDLKDDLKEYDLPYSKGSVKAYMKNVQSIAKNTLDTEISMKELTVLLWNAPGLLEDVENLVMIVPEVMEPVAELSLQFYVEENPGVEYTYEDVQLAADTMTETVEDLAELQPIAAIAKYVFLAVLVLFGALALGSAVGHICNKGRWVKYMLLSIVLVFVVFSIIGLPIASELLAGAFADVPMLEDVQLKITAAPFIALALLIVPVVLDIIFRNKKTI